MNGALLQSECRRVNGSCSYPTPTVELIESESSVRDELRRERPMPTKNRTASKVSDIRTEYDLSKLTGRVQGKHYAQATAGVAMVMLESDIAEAFPTGRAVNKALRSVLLAQRKATLA